MPTLIIHIENSEPIKADVDVLPEPGDTMIVAKNPRDRADKDLYWIDDGVSVVLFPFHRVNYVQVLPDAGEDVDLPRLFRD